MRTAILFASININWMLRRIVEGQGDVVAPIDEQVATLTFVLFVVFVVMDIVDFARKKAG